MIGGTSSSLRTFAARGLARQAVAYGMISALALGLDVAVFLLLANWGSMASISAIAGYVVGLIAHFLLSVRFVFDAGATGRSGTELFARFALSGLAGLVLTAAIVALLADLAGLAPILAKIAAVITSFSVVLLLRRTVVFARAGVQRPVKAPCNDTASQ